MEYGKTTGILFCAGLGDGLQMIPLWKALNERGDKLTLLLVSPYFEKEFAENLNLFDKVISLKKITPHFILNNLFRFDRVIIDYYSSGPLYSLIACLIAKKAYTNRSKWYLRLLPNLVYRKPIEQEHNMLQNLHLGGITLSSLGQLNYRIPYFPIPPTPAFENLKNYIVVQLNAANLQANYKNWPTENWIWLLGNIRAKYFNLQIAVIGDYNEKAMVDKVNEEIGGYLDNLAGQTDISTLASVLSKAKMYLGLDSGPMHLAAMLSVPTFTLWGPSDPKTIGYEMLDRRLHKDVCLSISCHPCLSFIRPNKSFVDHPSKCPNPVCVKKMRRELVWKEFCDFWELLYRDNELSKNSL